jgi:hypothetical protein
MDTGQTPPADDAIFVPPEDEPPLGPAAPAASRGVAAKIAAVIAVALLVGAGVGFAAGLDWSSSGSASTSAAADSPPSGFGGGVSGEQHIQGTITAKTSGTVTVESARGAATYTVNATTEIVRNGRAATLADVKVGDPVLVHVYPSSSGQMIVERLFAGSSSSNLGPPAGGAPPVSSVNPT